MAVRFGQVYRVREVEEEDEALAGPGLVRSAQLALVTIFFLFTIMAVRFMYSFCYLI